MNEQWHEELTELRAVVQDLSCRLTAAEQIKTGYRQILAAIEELGIELHPLPHSPTGQGITKADFKRLVRHFKAKRGEK